MANTWGEAQAERRRMMSGGFRITARTVVGPTRWMSGNGGSAGLWRTLYKDCRRRRDNEVAEHVGRRTTHSTENVVQGMAPYGSHPAKWTITPAITDEIGNVYANGNRTNWVRPIPGSWVTALPQAATLYNSAEDIVAPTLAGDRKS